MTDAHGLMDRLVRQHGEELVRAAEESRLAGQARRAGAPHRWWRGPVGWTRRAAATLVRAARPAPRVSGQLRRTR